jgi:hypothetical protein
MNIMRIVLPVLVLALATPAAAQPSARLQLLVNDTVAQLQLAYRHNATEQRRRYDQLSTTVDAWRDAKRSDANNRLLEDWLRRAIRSSMPGSQAPLPPTPRFERPPVEAPPEVNPPQPVATPIRREVPENVGQPPNWPAATANTNVAPLATDESDKQLPTVGTQDIEDNAVGDPFLDDPEESGKVE